MQSINRRAVAFTIFISAVTSILLIACQNPSGSLSEPAPTVSQNPTPTPGVSAWVMPVDVNNTTSARQDDYYDLGWKSFIALNWPALDGQRGAPDTSKKIGAQASDGSFLPVVWETYKTPGEVFLAGAATPPDWNNPPPPPPSACTQVPKGAQVLQMVSKAAPTILDDLIQAGFPLSPVKKTRGPLIDQNQNYVRYDVRLNQSEFTYVIKYQYYNADVQKQAVNNNTFNDPPQGFEDYVQPLPDHARQGAVELKASWRILDPKKDILDRYYRQQSWLVDPDGKCSGPYTMGLVGLHILRLTKTTHATWYWATFEQIDNVAIEDKQPPSRPNGQPLTPSFNPNGPPAPPQFPSGYSYEPPPVQGGKPLPPNPKPVDVWRITDVPADAEAKNNYYRGQLSDTVWRYYKMIDTMNPYVTNSPQPQKYWVPATDPKVYINTADMANTTMETYLQANSCIVCHAYAVPIGAMNFKPLPQFQIFTFLLRHAQKPSASPPKPSPSPPK